MTRDEKQARWDSINHDIETLKPEHKLTGFLPLPRSMLNWGLSSTALVVYAMLLDRATLSRKNGWHDPCGVFVVYPNQSLALDLAKSVSAIKDALRALERAGLILRWQDQAGRANRIYLRVPPFTVQKPREQVFHSPGGLPSGYPDSMPTGTQTAFCPGPVGFPPPNKTT